MHSAAHCGFMGENCAKAVDGTLVRGGNGRRLSTWTKLGSRSGWKNSLLLPVRLHKFFMRFSAGLIGFFTEVVPKFSPLSTALIIRSMRINERNLLSRNGG